MKKLKSKIAFFLTFMVLFNGVKSQNFFGVYNAPDSSYTFKNFVTGDTIYRIRTSKITGNRIEFNPRYVIFTKSGTQITDYMPVATATAAIVAMTNSINLKADAAAVAGSFVTLSTGLSSANSTSVTVNGTTAASASNPSFTIPSTTVTGTGIVTVTNTGFTSTVNVRTPTFTTVGSVTVAGTYPNYTVSTGRIEKYLGVTGAAGTFTANFATSYTSTPNIQAQLVNPASDYQIVKAQVSTTGFTTTAKQMNSVLSLGVLPTYSVISSATVNVIITDQ